MLYGSDILTLVTKRIELGHDVILLLPQKSSLSKNRDLRAQCPAPARFQISCTINYFGLPSGAYDMHAPEKLTICTFAT